MLTETKSPIRTDASVADEIARLLRQADESTAAAVRLLSRAGGLERQTGLPTEIAISLRARRPGWDARELTNAADTLRLMPVTAGLLQSGVISWSQARAIIRDVRTLDAAGRSTVDELVGRLAPKLVDSEPETLIDAVQDKVHRLRQDLAVKREQRAIESSFLILQPRFDGGGRIYGEAPAEPFATITTAVDALADRPVNRNHEDGPSRPQQLMAAFVAMCEASLAGGHAGTRPRPRFLATVDLDAFAQEGNAEGARILTSIVGKPRRITRLATETLLCDAEVIPVVFKDGQPVGIGDVRQTVPEKIRRAAIARDGGCRFPGCQVPASWTDAHHLDWRQHGGDANINNVGLFCRTCHSRIHRYRWDIVLHDDASMTFTHRGRTYRSHSRTRPPRE